MLSYAPQEERAHAWPADLFVRSCLGLDVRSVCAAAAVCSAWQSELEESVELWSLAMLMPQVPQDPPWTYSTWFTASGVVKYFQMMAGPLELDVQENLHRWEADGALRKLSVNPVPRKLCRFVRLAHSGVEAELLKAKKSRQSLLVYTSLEALNFFPFPVWVLVSYGDRCKQGTATFSLQGFQRESSSFSSRGGSIVMCKAWTSSTQCSDLIYCPPFVRLEIGEHCHRTCRDNDGMLHFAYATELYVSQHEFAPRSKLESFGYIGMSSVSGHDLLIPTTRGIHYAMAETEWAARGLNPERDMHSLVLSPCDDEASESGLAWQWTAIEPSHFCEEYGVTWSLNDILYEGDVSMNTAGFV